MLAPFTYDYLKKEAESHIGMSVEEWRKRDQEKFAAKESESSTVKNT